MIADAQLLFAESLGVALVDRYGFTVLQDHPTKGTDVLALAVAERPDVALLDYWLPDMESSALIKQFLRRLPYANIITLSWFHGPPQIQAALDAGAVGFLPKGVHIQTVADAIQQAVAGDTPVFAEEIAEMLDRITVRTSIVEERSERFATLTPRELHVLQLLATGLSALEIHQYLEISEATARTHIRRILAKTGAHSQVELIALAREQGLLR